jgi:hypothetical protein
MVRGARSPSSAERIEVWFRRWRFSGGRRACRLIADSQQLTNAFAIRSEVAIARLSSALAVKDGSADPARFRVHWGCPRSIARSLAVAG